jgi:hypothetical protein
MAGKQIVFPPLQKEVRWLAPVMLAVSVLCVVAVVAILVTGVEGEFIGPWF